MNFFRYYFSLLLLLFSLIGVANTSLVDSLEKSLSKVQPDTKDRLEILSTLTKECASSSFEKALKYGKDAQSLAQTLKLPQKEAEVIVYLGDAYSYQNDYSTSNKFYNEAYNLFNRIGNKEGMAISLIGVGLNYYFAGQMEEALKKYNEALLLARAAKSAKEQGNALFNMGQVNRKKNMPDSAIHYYKLALQEFESINEINGLAKTNNSLGLINADKGNFSEAVTYYQKALLYREKAGEQKSCAILYNNIGNVLFKWGKYDNAIVEYQKAIKIFDKIGSQEGIARCFNNIGLIYENLTRGEQYQQNIGSYNKALEFHTKAREIWEKLDNKYELANSLNNIANVAARKAYSKCIEKMGVNWENNSQKSNLSFIKNEYASAISNYRKSLALRELLNDKNGIAGSLINLGKIYICTAQYDLAGDLLSKAVRLNNELGNRYEEACAYYEIGLLHYSTGDYQRANVSLNKSFELAQKNNMVNILKDVYLMQSRVSQALGDYKGSLIAYQRFVDIQDSLLNENNLKQIAELQTQYETEKKEQYIQLLNKDAKLKDIQIKQKNATIYFFFAGMLMVIVIAFLLFRQNKERKRVNNELAHKNEVITQHKQEITDSIYYAKRIQNAAMPFETHLRQLLPDSFIYFRPRDIVSGDFYWVAEKKGKIIVVAADCTGHGVPGAFMSMLGISQLNNIVVDKENITASEILNALRANIIESLHQSGREGENKDGMDISLYILDLNEMQLEFAGANNSVYIIRNGELLELKADRMPIGIHEKAQIPFVSKQFSLQKGDMIYSFSDGIADQFGGPMNKKFMSANVKKLLISIFNKPMDEQSQILHSTMNEWMNDMAQIDDMMLIGVRV